MNTTRLTQVRKHFVNATAPRHIQRHNMRAWVKSVRFLGSRWALTLPVERLPYPLIRTRENHERF